MLSEKNLVCKKSGKAMRTFGKELNFMKIWSGEDGVLFGWGRYVKTDAMIFKSSKCLVCVAFIDSECM